GRLLGRLQRQLHAARSHHQFDPDSLGLAGDGTRPTGPAGVAGVNAVIIGSGPLRPRRALRELLRRANLIICADGGLRAARALGIAPHPVIGEFDSVEPALLAWPRRTGTRLIQPPREKDPAQADPASQQA